MSDVKVCVVFYDGGGTMHANKKIARPADLKGLKIRSPNATAARFYREAGATTVQLSAAEAAEAMERGVADALSFPWNLLRALGIDRAVNHHLDMNFYSLGTALLINKGTYARLSPKQKEVIDSHCTADWAEKLPPAWIKWEQEGRIALKNDPKHTVYAITEDDKKAWKEIVPKVQQQWEREVAQKGIDGPKAFGELKALLEKYNARLLIERFAGRPAAATPSRHEAFRLDASSSLPGLLLLGMALPDVGLGDRPLFLFHADPGRVRDLPPDARHRRVLGDRRSPSGTAITSSSTSCGTAPRAPGGC